MRCILALLVFILSYCNLFGQTTTVNVDLSAATDTSVTISNLSRNGDACAGSNCIIFNIIVNSGSDLINFNADQITGASFYSINCGPQIPIGTPACISGLTSVQISFCKVGKNVVDYFITASTNVKASNDLYLRQGCTGTMSVTGLQSATTTWTSIFPGAAGAYNSYLSQTSGSNSVNVTPQIGSPAYIDYRVSGTQNTVCSGLKSDTVRVYTSPALAVSISPSSPLICPGTSVQLTATPSGGNPAYTYFWSTGATTQSITVNTPGTYSVSVMDNTTGCAATMQQVVVAATTPPAAPTASGVTICSGNTATLTATGPGGTYQWYSSSSGGSILFTGASFTTPVLTTNTTYYVETILGCTSLRTPVTVSVSPIPSAPVVSGITICEGTSGVLTASSPGGTYQWYDAAAGGTLLATGTNFTTPNLIANTTYYVQTIVNGCTSSRTTVTVSVTATPSAPTVTTATVCAGNSGTLTATAPSGTYQWYDAPSGGNLLSTSATYTSSVLTSSTTFYVQTTINGCASPRTAATITVIPLIDPEFEYSSGTYCKSGDPFTPAPDVYTSGGGTFSATPGLVIDASTGVINVSASPLGTYTVTFTNSSPCPRSTSVSITITNAPDATFTYNGPFCLQDNNPEPVFLPGASGGIFSSTSGLVFVSTSTGEINLSLSTAGTYIVTNTIAPNGGCAAASYSFSITIKPSPAAPTVSPVTICSGNTATLTATAPGGSYEWFSAASGGTSLGTSFSYITPVLSATTTFYVQATIDGCTGPRAAVTVTVNPIPAAPSAVGTTICSGSAAVLTVNASGGFYEWFSAASGGISQGTGLSFTTPALSATTTYYVQTTILGCTSARTAVTATVNPIPVSPTVSGVGICSGSTATLTATAPGGNYQWYDSATGGNLIATGNNYTTPTLTASTTYYVQTSVNGCTSSRTAVAITVSPAPSAPAASGVTICSGTTATLTASLGAGTYQWYDAASGGNLLSANATYTSSILISNTTFYVQTTVNGCSSSRTPVTVTITSIPAAPTVSTATICPDNNATLTASAPGGFYQWYDAAAGGNLLATGATFISPVLTLTTTYYVQTTINGCTSPRTAAVITVYPIINPEFKYTSGTYCKSGTSITPPPDIFTSGGGSFSAPTGLVIDPVTGEINVTASLLGTYPVTFTNNSPCPKSTSVNVTITNAPDASFSYNGPFCLQNEDPMPLFQPGASAGVFSASSAGLVFVSTSTGEINLSASTAGTYTITNSIAASGGCSASIATFTITIFPRPPAPTVSTATICPGNVANLAVTSPGAIFQWFDSISGGTLLATGSSFTSPVLTTTTTYYVQTELNGCASLRTAANITVIPFVTPEFEYSAGTYCKSGASTTPAPTIYVSGGGGTFSASSNLIINQTTGIINVSGSAVGTYTVNFTSNSPCPRSTSAKITITNAPDARFSYSLPLCIGDATADPAFPPGASAGVFSASSPDLVFVSTSTGEIDLEASKAGTYTITNTIAATGSCSLTSSTFIITINSLPAAPTVPTPTICAGNTATFSAIAPGGLYQWYDAPVGGNLLNTGLFYTTPVLTANTTYYVQTTVDGCTSPRTAATAIVIPVPATPAARANSPVCKNTSINLSTDFMAGASYLWVGPDGFISTLQNPVINNASKLNAGIYSIMVTLNGCTSIAGTINVFVDEPPVSNAGPDQIICITANAVALNGRISGGSTNGVWQSSGTGTFSPSNSSLNANYIPSLADKAAGTITLTLISTNNGGCSPAASSMILTLRKLAVVNAGPDQTVCADNPVITLNGSVTGPTSGVWGSSGSGRFIPSNTALNAVYIASSSDIKNKSVTLTLISAGDGICSPVTDNMQMTINPLPVVNLKPEIFVLEKSTITLSPAINDTDVQYEWTPGTGLSNSRIKNPVFSGLDDQVYILQITNKWGCTVKDTISVNVLQLPQIPNTFTPNGDGINDLWNISELKDYPTASVEVYNRYGVKIFNSIKYNQPWDGSYRGKPLPTGTYYYIIDTKFPGQIFSGYITILR